MADKAPETIKFQALPLDVRTQIGETILVMFGFDKAAGEEAIKSEEVTGDPSATTYKVPVFSKVHNVLMGRVTVNEKGGFIAWEDYSTASGSHSAGGYAK